MSQTWSIDSLWSYKLRHGIGISAIIDLYYKGRYSYVSSGSYSMRVWAFHELMGPIIEELNNEGVKPEDFPMRDKKYRDYPNRGYLW